MTKEYQSLDAYSCYEMRELRLVNFHNFTDETINIKGSLFLIGNNGTGKTTIIDALHLILTGGQQLTYNAATIFGPRSEAGRTLAGVILRHDFESGKIVRESGAVGYAALELRHPKTKHVLTIGIGAFVQSLDQRPETWGFIVEEPLKNIPLTIRANSEDEEEADRLYYLPQVSAGGLARRGVPLHPGNAGLWRPGGNAPGRAWYLPGKKSVGA